MPPVQARERSRKTVVTTVGAAAAAFGLVYFLTRTKAGAKVKAKVQTTIDKLNPSLKARYKGMRDLIRQAAAEANIPPEVLAGTVRAESSYRNDSPTREACIANGITCTCSTASPPAIGVAQIKLATAGDRGYTGDAPGLCDVATNLRYAAREIRRLMTRYEEKPELIRSGDDYWTAVRLAYNLGARGYEIGRAKAGNYAYAAKSNATTDSIRSSGLAGFSVMRLG